MGLTFLALLGTNFLKQCVSMSCKCRLGEPACLNSQEVVVSIEKHAFVFENGQHLTGQRHKLNVYQVYGDEELYFDIGAVVGILQQPSLWGGIIMSCFGQLDQVLERNIFSHAF